MLNLIINAIANVSQLVCCTLFYYAMFCSVYSSSQPAVKLTVAWGYAAAVGALAYRQRSDASRCGSSPGLATA